MEPHPEVGTDTAEPPPQWRVRRASGADASAVLALFDEAIEWFVSFGNDRQWGTEPWSKQERRIRTVTGECELPEAWVAELPDGGIVGALVLGDAMDYVPPASTPELYVRMLIASRRPEARGAGRRLMRFAEGRASAAGLSMLRVDCYAGGTGDLVRFYESCGYTRLSTFEVSGWPGQVLGREID
ncbi:GNAT family N-acetyltransferase [Leucobacter sp. G161]|uniref:GNAT family N-acetyltransferase n=1 Tax=Leucobacter sp. G161 TaxID=663704 RepID=UPI00073C7891|nr:GNAT family N-acetyltransferase [Leucobacter sp. G161]KUF06139.1 acetyltransferase [Leucobacter sp. G161]